MIDPQIALHQTEILLGKESAHWMRGYMWVITQGIRARRPKIVGWDFVRGWLSAKLFLEIQHQNSIIKCKGVSYAALAREMPGVAGGREVVRQNIRTDGDRDKQ